MANKKKASAERRTEAVIVAVSPKEKKTFVKLAEKRRQTLSELIRQELFRASDFEKARQLQNA